MTFSEKETKMSSQLHISKLEILIFGNKTHEKKIFHSFFHSEKCVMSHKRQKVTTIMDFIEET